MMPANGKMVSSVMENAAPTLSAMPQEIMQMIIRRVLAAPEEADLTSVNGNTSGKYNNYLSIFLVNKALRESTSDVLRRSMDFIVVSSNSTDLEQTLIFLGIPIISNHDVEKIRCHVMIIDVFFRNVRNRNSNKLILIRKAALESLAKCIKVLSLSKDRAGFNNDIETTITFHHLTVGRKPLTPEVMLSLLSPLKDFIKGSGVVNVQNTNDPDVTAFLTNYETTLRPRRPDEDEELYTLRSLGWPLPNVQPLNMWQENWYYALVLGKWLMQLGDDAMNDFSYDVASHRYDITWCMAKSLVDPTLVRPPPVLQHPMVPDPAILAQFPAPMLNMNELLMLSAARMADAFDAVGNVNTARNLMVELVKNDRVKSNRNNRPTTLSTMQPGDQLFIKDLEKTLKSHKVGNKNDTWQGKWPRNWSFRSPAKAFYAAEAFNFAAETPERVVARKREFEAVEDEEEEHDDGPTGRGDVFFFEGKLMENW